MWARYVLARATSTCMHVQYPKALLPTALLPTAPQTVLAVEGGLKWLKRGGRGVERKLVLAYPPISESRRHLGDEPLEKLCKPALQEIDKFAGAGTWQRLCQNGTLELVSSDRLRGRTLDDSFVLLDESQNASATLIEHLSVRVSGSSKLVIIGDPKRQIDQGANWDHGALARFVTKLERKLAELGHMWACVLRFDGYRSERGPEAAIMQDVWEDMQADQEAAASGGGSSSSAPLQPQSRLVVKAMSALTAGADTTCGHPRGGSSSSEAQVAKHKDAGGIVTAARATAEAQKKQQEEAAEAKAKAKAMAEKQKEEAATAAAAAAKAEAEQKQQEEEAAAAAAAAKAKAEAQQRKEEEAEAAAAAVAKAEAQRKQEEAAAAAVAAATAKAEAQRRKQAEAQAAAAAAKAKAEAQRKQEEVAAAEAEAKAKAEKQKEEAAAAAAAVAKAEAEQKQQEEAAAAAAAAAKAKAEAQRRKQAEAEAAAAAVAKAKAEAERKQKEEAAAAASRTLSHTATAGPRSQDLSHGDDRALRSALRTCVQRAGGSLSIGRACQALHSCSLGLDWGWEALLRWLLLHADEFTLDGDGFATDVHLLTAAEEATAGAASRAVMDNVVWACSLEAQAAQKEEEEAAAATAAAEAAATKAEAARKEKAVAAAAAARAVAERMEEEAKRKERVAAKAKAKAEAAQKEAAEAEQKEKDLLTGAQARSTCRVTLTLAFTHSFGAEVVDEMASHVHALCKGGFQLDVQSAANTLTAQSRVSVLRLSGTGRQLLCAHDFLMERAAAVEAQEAAATSEGERHVPTPLSTTCLISRELASQPQPGSALTSGLFNEVHMQSMCTCMRCARAPSRAGSSPRCTCMYMTCTHTCAVGLTSGLFTEVALCVCMCACLHAWVSACMCVYTAGSSSW